jgi:hypothetical protein
MTTAFRDEETLAYGLWALASSTRAASSRRQGARAVWPGAVA